MEYGMFLYIHSCAFAKCRTGTGPAASLRNRNPFACPVNQKSMMNRYLSCFLSGVLVLLVLLAAGCTGTTPAGNSTEQTTIPEGCNATASASPVVTTGTTLPVPAATTERSVTVTGPVATLTTKPIPPPTLSSIYVYGINYQVFALSRDTAGVVTTGNITLSGVIDSLSSYPLTVVMKGEMYGAHSLPGQPKAVAYATVNLTPHGTAGFVMEMDNYVFNDWPSYAVEPDTWNLTVENVSVAP
jgi:hypothetical protein